MQKRTKKHKEALKKAWIKRKEKGLGKAWNKGIPHTEEQKEALKKAWEKRKEKGLGDAWNKGKKLSAEHAKKCGLAMKGKKHTEEAKKKMSEARTGKKNWAWKEEHAGDRAKHTWVERKKGKAKTHKCLHCGKQAQHWANIDHTYKRVEEDYLPLCAKCHKKFDK